MTDRLDHSPPGPPPMWLPASTAQSTGMLMLAGPSEDPLSAPRPPRQPHSLQGLLRFAMEATRAEDASGNSSFQVMDEERRKFLEEALHSLTVDVARVLQDAIRVLADSERVRAVGSGDQCPVEISAAFKDLMEFVDDIDIANDFYKLGGFTVFPILLGAQHDGIRANGCEMLAVLCQNNPFTQSRALEAGFLNILISMADNEQAPRVLAATLYALSCSMREFEPACKEFIAQNGCAILLKLFRFEKENVRTKTTFLTGYLCRNSTEAKDFFLKNNLIGILAELLLEGRNTTSEHILLLLVSFADAKDALALEQMQSPAAGLKQALETYMEKSGYHDAEEYHPEKEYCDQLLKIVWDVQPREDAVDR